MKKEISDQIKGTPQTTIERKHVEPYFNQLLKAYGKNKELPKGYELQALTALSYYPELTNIKIEFAFNTSSHPLAARPKISALHLPATQRTYQILISCNIKQMLEPVLFSGLSFNRQVGVIGHELAHIVDYISKSTPEIVMLGVRYLFPSKKSKIEKATDNLTIEKGLGFQLLDYADLIKQLSQKYPEENYYTGYEQYYMGQQEIQTRIKSLDLYRPLIQTREKRMSA